MLSEIVLTAKIGNFTLMRIPNFKFNSGRRMVSYAEMTITDIDYELYKSIGLGEKVSVLFGYRTGEQAEASFTITSLAALGKDSLRIIAIGAEHSLVNTRITESFNSEQPAAVIRRIATLAGLQIGTIDISVEPIPHLIFSNTTLFQALVQVRNILLRNGSTASEDFWVYEGKLNWGSHRAEKINQAAVYGNILSHKVKTDGMNTLELPLTPAMQHSEAIEEPNRAYSPLMQSATFLMVMKQGHGANIYEKSIPKRSQNPFEKSNRNTFARP